MIRKVIMPLYALIPTVMLCGFVVLLESAIGSDMRGSLVTRTHAVCTPRSLDADGSSLTLNLSCDNGSKATTRSPATIKAYVAAPTAPLTCKLFRSGNAECVASKGSR